MHKTKVHHRCFLHSKKPMPNSVWREALQNLIENDLPDIATLTEIEESTYILNLQNHLKKRKFCSTCKENILCAYENMLEEASKYSDGEDEEENPEDDEQGEIMEPQCSEDMENLESCENEITLNEISANKNDQMISDKIDYCGDDEGHYDESRVDTSTHSNSGSCNLMSYIRFCPERRKIIIPLEMEAFTEFLSKAEIDIGMQAKHASTREAAQEELLICLGTTLKDKLQSLWRYKKSEEMIKLLFLKVAANCFLDNVGNAVHNKYIKMGHKTIIEEYFKDIEAAEELKKEKLKRKRIKKKEKKRLLKLGQLPNTNNEDHKSNGGTKNEHGEQDIPFSENDKSPIPPEHKSQTNFNSTPKNAKTTTIKSATLDKKIDTGGFISPSSNQHNSQSPINSGSISKFEASPERVTHTLQELNNNIGNNTTSTKNEKKRSKKMKMIGNGKVEVSKIVDEKISTHDDDSNNKSIRTNKFDSTSTTSIVIDKEKELLKAMGWNENNNSEDSIEIDENEITMIKNKWKEIEEHRDVFRKNAREKFKQFIASSKATNNINNASASISTSITKLKH